MNDQYYVQALFDFNTNELNEIKFRAGDILKVLNQIDNQWLNGKLVFSLTEDEKNRTGNFPLNFVSNRIDLVKGVDVYFMAQFDFPKVENGDLEFYKDEIIVGLNQIDSEWWSGRCLNDSSNKIGIFPLTHVKIIDFLNEGSSSAPDEYIQAKVIENFDGNSESADYNFEYLNLISGDYILVTDTIDSYWLKGENIEGKKGFFPKFCVELLVDERCKTSRQNSYATTASSFEDLSYLDEYVTKLFQFSLSSENEDTSEPKIEDIEEDDNKKTLIEKDCNNNHNIIETDFETLKNLEIKPGEHECVNNEEFSTLIATDFETIKNNQEAVKKPIPPPLPPKPAFLRLKYENQVKIFEHKRAAEEEEIKKLNQFQNELETSSLYSNDEKFSTIPVVTDNKRNCVINELFSTEKQFYEQMNALYNCFSTQSNQQPESFSLSLLFSNMNEILQISEQFLTYLENEILKKNENDIRIGLCLLKCANDMQQYYAIYCRDFATKNDLIKKYENNKEINEYIKGKFVEIKNVANNLDLSALLIKPVQRITKYSLFIDQLIKYTSSTHDDYSDLKDASAVFSQVLLFINEYKRRKDLILKYKNKEDSRNLLQKITMNTVRKKSNRLSAKISTALGLYDQTIDLRFNHEEDRFRNIEREIKVFIKESNHMLTHFKETLDNNITTLDHCLELFYEDRKYRSFILMYKNVFYEFLNDNFDKFMKTVFTKIWNPLTELVSSFEMPNKLIEKRFNKLLDYDKARGDIEKKEINEKTKHLSTIVDDTKRIYEALNLQLLEELPELTNKSTLLLQICMTTFTTLFTNSIKYLNANIKEIEIRLDLPKTSSLEAIKIYLKQIQFEHQMNLTVHDKIQSSHSQFIQTEEHRVSLREKYTGDKIYEATHNNVEDDVKLQIEVKKGDIVGVIKNCGPTGNTEIWFCDNGDKKGFVPSGILKIISSKPFESIEYYITLYDFNATRNNMLTIKKDQILKVVAKNDTKGDKQWWLVENQLNQTGYIPSNYIEFYKRT